MSIQDSLRTTASITELRKFPRFPFGLVQQIAEIVDGEFPSPDTFEHVQCVDVSRSGFAFYRRTLPEHDDIVVALGEAPDIVYLTARIVHSRRVDRREHTYFRIGCQFTGRAEPEQHALALKRQRDIESGFFLMAGQTPDWNQ